MCAREDFDFQGQALTSNIAEVVESKLQTKLECVQRKLDALLEKLGEGEKNKWSSFLKGVVMKKASWAKVWGKNDGFACLMEAQFNNKRTGNVLARSILRVKIT